MEILSPLPVGSFLVRCSESRIDSLALSVKVPNSAIVHYLITSGGHGWKIKVHIGGEYITLNEFNAQHESNKFLNTFRAPRNISRRSYRSSFTIPSCANCSPAASRSPAHTRTATRPRQRKTATSSTSPRPCQRTSCSRCGRPLDRVRSWT